jgi:tyrosine aminotransferase
MSAHSALSDSDQGSLAEVQTGARRLAQVILGASHLAQSIIPTLLNADDPDLTLWKQTLISTLRNQAQLLVSRLSDIQGLEVIAPQGALYAMVRILPDSFDLTDDVTFSSDLLKEENVFVLPGSAFGMPNFIRVVFCSSEPFLQEATDRIAAFCTRHRKSRVANCNAQIEDPQSL